MARGVAWSGGIARLLWAARRHQDHGTYFGQGKANSFFYCDPSLCRSRSLDLQIFDLRNLKPNTRTESESFTGLKAMLPEAIETPVGYTFPIDKLLGLGYPPITM